MRTRNTCFVVCWHVWRDGVKHGKCFFLICCSSCVWKETILFGLHSRLAKGGEATRLSFQGQSLPRPLFCTCSLSSIWLFQNPCREHLFVAMLRWLCVSLHIKEMSCWYHFHRFWFYCLVICFKTVCKLSYRWQTGLLVFLFFLLLNRIKGKGLPSVKFWCIVNTDG